jgi:hypothetical protein
LQVQSAAATVAGQQPTGEPLEPELDGLLEEPLEGIDGGGVLLADADEEGTDGGGVLLADAELEDGGGVGVQATGGKQNIPTHAPGHMPGGAVQGG